MSYILNKKLLCSLAIAGTMINSTQELWKD
jgi:hypothetical protein